MVVCTVVLGVDHLVVVSDKSTLMMVCLSSAGDNGDGDVMMVMRRLSGDDCDNGVDVAMMVIAMTMKWFCIHHTCDGCSVHVKHLVFSA